MTASARRQVDEKYPAPGEMVDDESAKQRTDDCRNSEYAAKEALIAATFAGRHDVADDRNRGDDKPAVRRVLARYRTQSALEGLRHAAQRRTDQENDDGASSTSRRPKWSPSLP